MTISPQQTAAKPLKRFSPFVATQILGESLVQSVTVDSHIQFTATDHFSKKKLLYSARLEQEDRTPLFLAEGTKLKVWVTSLDGVTLPSATS